MKKIIPALAMLLISAIVMSTASFAWFSMNQSVVADGMEITAMASGSLIISKSNAAAQFAGSSTTSFDDATSAEITNYVNATHYDSTGKWVWADPDLMTVDPDKGTATPVGSSTYTILEDGDRTPATTLTGTQYYKDYIVYIASAGDAIEGQTLTASVTFPKVPDSTNETRKALSVAFFVLGDEAVGYNGTNGQYTTWKVQNTVAMEGAAIATYLDGEDTADTAGNPVSTVTLATGKDIPAAVTGTGDKTVIPVVMRVYLDGEANDGATDPTCYVNSAKIDTSGLSVSVKFAVSKTPATDPDQGT